MLFACFPCFFFRTQDPLLQQVWSRVNPDTGYLKSSKQGAATARQGNFAFICEEPFGDYLATLPPCDLRTIQNFLITDNARTYNFAAQKRDDLNQNITAINKVIERMSNTMNFKICMINLSREGPVQDVCFPFQLLFCYPACFLHFQKYCN